MLDVCAGVDDGAGVGAGVDDDGAGVDDEEDDITGGDGVIGVLGLIRLVPVIEVTVGSNVSIFFF
ncbi:MAG: hypothetical protein EBU80_10790 [Chitinophagia bacterium]|nr:hypothetical protein [Chitinophagia bacterium]